MGFVDFTKLLFALSSLVQPLKRVRSIPEHVFVILNQRKAWAGRFQEETAGKNRSDNKMAVPKASVHPVRNRLCYHFFFYQTNESCSESVSRRLMLLISFNKFCLRVTAPTPLSHGHRHPGSNLGLNPGLTRIDPVTFTRAVAFLWLITSQPGRNINK